jgi:hypothetical protein
MEKIAIDESAILAKLSEVLVPPINTIVKPQEVLQEAIQSYYALENVLVKKVKDREEALEQARKDLEQAKRELALRTNDPAAFISKTAEEIAIGKINAIQTLSKKVKANFENGASTVLKQALKKVSQ